VTGAELMLSLTSRISFSLPTSRHERNIVALELDALAPACSELLTGHYRAPDGTLAMRYGGEPAPFGATIEVPRWSAATRTIISKLTDIDRN
jgi:hypothetical protein